MGADIKSLRQRIRSVDSTRHLTKAMGLVASSKVRRANDAMMKGRAYAGAVRDMVDTLSACPECRRSPFMRPAGGERIRLIVIAGDRGLCGGYNANIFRLMRDWPDAEVIPIGKRAAEHYAMPVNSSERFSSRDGYALAEKLCADFAEDRYDRLGIVSTRYISMMSQEAVLTWVLPIEAKEGKSAGGMVFEPNEAAIFKAAIPEYVAGLIMAAVRESFACETSARRMAMDSAEKNAQQMISDLQLAYNSARQSAITQEITEIVAGSGD